VAHELFDAFYVMSYTATTIGFGEIPYPFSYAQRLWMTFSIYMTVIAGLHAWAIFACCGNRRSGTPSPATASKRACAG